MENDPVNVLGEMMARGHERVCCHFDARTGLRAIIAIHSTRLGNALGGTRRWCYPNEHEAMYDVLRLSEGMTCKAVCANLPMGGAKSVILLPEKGLEPTEAEARAMGRFIDTFDGAYIAAEDVGLDAQFIDWMLMETDHAMGGDTVSTGGDPSPFTARGTFNGLSACLRHAGRRAGLDGMTVAVQGLGHVGYDFCRRVHETGGRLVVADIDSTRVERVIDEFAAMAVDPGEILSVPCDVLAPCALGAVLGPDEIADVQASIICGAANNILLDPERDAPELARRGILYGPDFVVNAGGLIWLAGLHLGYSREELDRRNDLIEDTTLEILEQARTRPSTWHAAMAMVDRRLTEGTACEEKHAHAG